MKRECGIVAVGRLDQRGVFAGDGVARRWSEVDAEPPGDGRVWRAWFDGPFRTFRRLDLLSRALLVTAEAAGVGRLLTEVERRETAVVVGSTYGSLDADLRFAASLAPGREAEAARFPYTLPSTAVGELALRYGLRGPSLFLSVGDDPSVSLLEARQLVEEGAVPTAVAAHAEALGEDVAPPGVPPMLEVTLVVIRAGSASVAGADWGRLDSATDPWRSLAAAVDGA